jgi:hypothetical protein
MGFAKLADDLRRRLSCSESSLRLPAKGGPGRGARLRALPLDGLNPIQVCVERRSAPRGERAPSRPRHGEAFDELVA